MADRFELILFSTDVAFVRDAVAAGVDGVIVDWESRGKEARQAAADTQINHDTLDDLRRVRAATTARLLCRINGVGATTAREVDDAIAAGADELLVPMVRRAPEVEHVLDLTRDRCGVGILIETANAVEDAARLAALPLSRVYVGMNDLAIDRGSASLFDAVADGTIERVRRDCARPFGFAGLTLPSHGHPIPCRLLMGEMARLQCAFSFLRRSFHRDVREMPIADAIAQIRRGLAAARARSTAETSDDRRLLADAIARTHADDVAVR